MEKTPVSVQLIGKEKEHYLIKFPNLKIPVKVNHNLYTKMKHSKDYVFKEQNKKRFKNNSA
ncbi:hypothetical protein [Tamlana crocina]|uniref:Uncharacterized protein n=1 Tax=Tamlana crocina TaxID=393006 RepID=A0ABX1D8C4_9FLAO|nr:hypothetical protein [Tamlana crocina]NJX14610.1 hypothetical protein [Tamlana crocina]